MLTIAQIAQQHGIDTNKENFPVNTIRLFYLILIYSFITDNPKDAADKMIQVIPLVSSVLEKRTDLRLSAEEKNINNEWQTVETELNEIEKIIPGGKTSFVYLFSTVLPTQEDILFNIVNQAQSDGKVFKPTDIVATLKLRSMDSIAYSHLVCQLINQPEHNLAINYLTNLVYQVNDLMDSILFAKEDTENNNFSPFEIIRKSAQDSAEAKTMIKSLVEKFLNDKSQVSLPPQVQIIVDEFLMMLTAVLGDTTSEKPSEETTQS